MIFNYFLNKIKSKFLKIQTYTTLATDHNSWLPVTFYERIIFTVLLLYSCCISTTYCCSFGYADDSTVVKKNVSDTRRNWVMLLNVNLILERREKLNEAKTQAYLFSTNTPYTSLPFSKTCPCP